MATKQPEFFSSAAGIGSGLRVEPGTIQPKLIDNIAGGPTLAKLTPMAFNTSTKKWVVWDQDGTNGASVVRGFIWPDAVVTDATDDVIGQLLLTGKIHFDDLPAMATVDGAATAAGWNQAMRDAQTYGLLVEGIPSGV